MATYPNGISAPEEVRAQLGLGSYKTARLLFAKPRCAMVDTNRTPAGEVSAVVRETNRRGVSAFLPDETRPCLMTL